MLDLLSPMASIRQVVVWVAMWLRGMCVVVAPAIDIITYPFMDINFAEGVHFIGNSFLYLTFHVPAMTFDRCLAYKNEGAVMCIPDFEPVFAMLTAGIRSMGLCVDNWLDVMVLIVEAALGRPGPACTSLPDLLKDFDFKRNLFGTNATVIVGMTELMFARTDGWGVQYFSLDKDWQTVLHPGHQTSFEFIKLRLKLERTDSKLRLRSRIPFPRGRIIWACSRVAYTRWGSRRQRRRHDGFAGLHM